MKEMVISGASPVLMPTEDPGGKIVFVILLLVIILVCFVALMTFFAAVMRRPAKQSSDAIRESKLQTVLAGLAVYTVFSGIAAWLYSGAFIERLLETEIVPGLLAGAVLATVVPLLLSLLGAPGMFSYVGDQIAVMHGGDMSGLRRILLGTLVAVVAALFPIVGWFVIAPALLFASCGAFLVGKRRFVSAR